MCWLDNYQARTVSLTIKCAQCPSPPPVWHDCLWYTASLRQGQCELARGRRVRPVDSVLRLKWWGTPQIGDFRCTLDRLKLALRSPLPKAGNTTLAAWYFEVMCRVAKRVVAAANVASAQPLQLCFSLSVYLSFCHKSLTLHVFHSSSC